MLLPEDQLALRPFGRAPMGDVTLQRAQQPIRKTRGILALQFFEHGRCTDQRRAFEDRHDVAAPDLLKRIGAGSILPDRTLADRRSAAFDAPSAALADACFSGGDDLRHAILVFVHVPPDLQIDNVAT